MPSIREMFTSTEVEGAGVGDIDFDLDELLSQTDRALNESTRLRVPELEGQEADPVVDEPEGLHAPDDVDDAGGSEETADTTPQTEGVAETTTGVNPVDPLGLLPPERQAALLAMDRVFEADPVRRDAVLQALATPPAPPAPSFVEPQLPEEIHPESFEAQLWRQNVDTQRAVAGLIDQTRQSQMAFAKQQAVTAADKAGATFAARYEGKLDHNDILAIARHAGDSGIAARFANGATDLSAAYDQALEHVLWTNPAYRTKALGVEVPVPTPVADTPASQTRKRKLTALSSSASPVSGPSPTRAPLETRSDGRLTEGSRLSITKELANQMARRQNEGTF